MSFHACAGSALSLSKRSTYYCHKVEVVPYAHDATREFGIVPWPHMSPCTSVNGIQIMEVNSVQKGLELILAVLSSARIERQLGKAIKEFPATLITLLTQNITVITQNTFLALCTRWQDRDAKNGRV
eukprot:5408425-Amphidinium_carterae.1